MKWNDTRRSDIKPGLLWSLLAILVAIGVASAIGRTLIVSNLTWPQELRDRLIPITDVQQLGQYDQGFESNLKLTLLHIVPGALFLMLAPIQFSSRIRTRHIRFHRWAGRFLVLAAVLGSVSALVLAIVFRFTGPLASSASILFGFLFLLAIVRAFLAIRRGDIVRHREWMIRAFSIGIGISAIRIVGSVLFITTGLKPFDILGYSFWIGWLLTVAVGEIWIRRSRFIPHRNMEVSSV